MDTSDEEDLALLLLATSELDGIRCTKIEQVRFPLYYTIRSYTAFPNSTLLCEPVLGNPIVRFKLFACPRKRASYTRIVYSYVNSALCAWSVCVLNLYTYSTRWSWHWHSNLHCGTHWTDATLTFDIWLWITNERVPLLISVVAVEARCM